MAAPASQSGTTRIPDIAQSIQEGVNGPVNYAWYRFLLTLFQRTGGAGGNTGTITIDDVIALEQTFAQFASSQDESLAFSPVLAPVAMPVSLAEMVLAPQEQSGYAQAPFVVTPGTSPWVYTASAKEGFYIGGGTITSLAVQRGSTVLPIGNSASDIVDATPSFTAGSSISVTLPNSFGAVARLWVFFDGVFQGDDQIASLVGMILTFNSVIPAGTKQVYVKGLLQSAVGIGATLVELSPGDQVNVTYSSAPSVTILPR